MCSSSTLRISSSIFISAVADSEHHDVHDIEQPMYQVSAAQHLNCNDVEEGSFSNNDNMHGDLVCLQHFTSSTALYLCWLHGLH